MATLTGRQIGGFLIQEELGRGAMGVVFKARQLSMDRDVALKFLPKRLAQDEKLVARFLREARAAGQLSHPNIVGVHDAGVIEGLHFIAMEYVDGNSVHNRIREKGPYGEKEVLDIAGQIAEALKVAHARGILHRDIKPDNFLIDTSGRVRLADLGLARIQSKQDAELTQDGEAMGTPHYMSPEQCRGGEVDSRSDLYSLGASMYVMATGQTPYDAATAAAVMVKVLTEPHRPIKKFNPNLSPGFVALVEKMMSKDPARRYPDALHVLEAIEKCRQGALKPITTGHAKVTARPIASASRLKLLMYGAGAAVVALIAIGIMSRGRNTTAAGAQASVTPAANQPADAVVPSKEPVKAADTKTPDKTNKITPAPVPNPETDKPSQPIPTNTAEVETETPQHIKAMQEWRNLRLELSERGAQNPDQALSRIEEFSKRHTGPRVLRVIEPFVKEMREARQKMFDEWDATQKALEHEKAAGNKVKAFFPLMKFYETYPHSRQAEEAVKEIAGMVSDVRKETDKFAENGEFKTAEAVLNFLIAKIPDELTGPVKADLARIQAEHKKAIAFAAVDQRAFTSLCERAAAQAREADSSGKRFSFESSAQLIRESAPNLHAKKLKNEAESLAKVYSRASDVMKRMRMALEKKKSVELAGLGSFKSAGQLTGWDERGLTFQPPGLPPQPVPWKTITGENLVHIAGVLDVSDKQTPSELFELGALAFASGANAIAIEKLQQASNQDAGLKSMAEVALRILNGGAAPAVPSAAPAPAATDREALAKKIFNDAGAARIRKDHDAALKLQQRLIVELADTQFVQSHRQQIQELGLPGNAPEADPKKSAAKPADNDAEKLANLETITELKKLGWTDVKGEWVQDPNRKTTFKVTNGQLFAPHVDAAAQVMFQLDEGASISVYLRQENGGETFKALQERFEAYDLSLGRGYGVRVNANEAVIFGDKFGTASSAGSTRGTLERMAVPSKIDSKVMQPGPHTVVVSTRGDKLEITLDGKVWRSQDKLRAEGGVTIIVEGSAKVDSPMVGR